jgi:hypothetical protein
VEAVPFSYNLKRRSQVVLVETWNELHEGTDVCDSKEFGWKYMELTAKYAKLFRNDVVLPKTGPFANTRQVEWDADRTDEKLGMTTMNSGDAMLESTTLGRIQRPNSANVLAQPLPKVPTLLLVDERVAIDRSIIRP